MDHGLERVKVAGVADTKQITAVLERNLQPVNLVLLLASLPSQCQLVYVFHWWKLLEYSVSWTEVYGAEHWIVVGSGLWRIAFYILGILINQ